MPGQDLSVGLQALLVWLGNYGHLPYEKQQELLRELGNIDIGVGTLQATNARTAMAVEDSALAVTGVGQAATAIFLWTNRRGLCWGGVFAGEDSTAIPPC